jgi:putative redox protein
MSDLTVKLNWNGGSRFTCVNAGGIGTAIDAGKQSGASPAELLLEALGACASVDVVSILEEMRTPAAKFEVTLEADHYRTDPSYLIGARVLFDVWGERVTPDKLVCAINLSISKYCSVFHPLRDDLKLWPQFRIHATGAEASGNYQVIEMAPPPTEIDLSEIYRRGQVDAGEPHSDRGAGAQTRQAGE